MNPPRPDLPPGESARDIRRFLDRPQEWAQMSGGLQRIAYAIVGNERDAEDVVQGAWLEAIQHPQYDQGGGWLKKLVRFRALDVLRNKRRDPVRLRGELPDVPDSDGPDMRWKLEAQREVLEAVNTLKEPYLSTIMLRYFESKTPVQIAEQLGVPVRTVKTRLTRAHEQLRGRLGERYQDQFGGWAPAFIAFAGHRGLDVSSLTAPVAGLLLMKKATLIAVTLGAVALVPLALQWRGEVADGLTQEAPETVDLAKMEEPELETEAKRDEARISLPAEAQMAAEEASSAEFAFPRRPDDEVGSLSVRVTYSDGTPAEHVKLGVMPANAADSFLMSRLVYTNAAGFAQVDQLTPGPVGIGSTRIRREEVEVFPGENTHRDLEVEPGITYRGRVLDPGGRPVPGAHVFLADSAGGDTQTQPTAIANALGEYTVRDVRRHHYLSARADGHSPSLQVELTGEVGNTMELDLPLREGSGVLNGLALSPSGQPVIGARIRVEVKSRDGEHGKDPDTHYIWKWPLAFEMRTDAEGRFASKHVGYGPMRIKSRTETWQPWEKVIELDPGESREVTIQFEPGAALTGSVHSTEGVPIADASVFSGKYQDSEFYKVKTDDLGRFEVQGLVPGITEFSIYKKGFEQVDTRFTVSPSEPNHVEVALTEMASVRGVVVDESGAPLNRWLVAVESGPGHWSSSAWTDASGKFELLSIPEGATDLIVCSEDHWQSGTRLLLDSVLPTDGSLQIVVPDSFHPRSSVRLKLLVDGKPAPKETQIKLRSASRLTHRQVAPDGNGALHLETLAAQAYRFEVALSGYPMLHHRFELGAGQDLDLGTLEIGKGGRVHLQMEGLAEGETVRVDVLDELGAPVRPMMMENGIGESGPLRVGQALLRIHPEGRAVQFARPEIVAGETTSVRLVAEEGTSRIVHVFRANGKLLDNRTVIRMEDAQGNTHLYADNIHSFKLDTGLVVLEFPGLGIGTYQIRIEDPGGATKTIPLRIARLNGQEGDALSIELPW